MLRRGGSLVQVQGARKQPTPLASVRIRNGPVDGQASSGDIHAPCMDGTCVAESLHRSTDAKSEESPAEPC